jgi:Caspase domain
VTTQTYRALLIANSTFPADRFNLPELEGPRNDPALLRDALCDGEVGLFASDNVRLVTERTMAEVLSEAEDVLVSATQRDTLLLYYSGHGLLDQAGELFLCTRDTRSDRLRSTAVKASDLRGMMDQSAAGTMVVVLDCCHSGRFKGGDIPATLAGRGRFVVASSRSGELANDSHVRNHASLFTHHLVEGIMYGAEDHDGDGIVTLSELYDYVHAALGAGGRQVPQKRFEGDGDVALALRALRTAPRPQTELVDPALSAPVLDLSEMTVDLGEVDHDEVLPPERIAVINRGGGTLDWVAQSSADWIEVVAESSAIVVHLHPRPGPNRANVHVRDASGELKTVRLSVRVREPSTPEAPGPVHRQGEPGEPAAPPMPARPDQVSAAGDGDEIATAVAADAVASPPVEPPGPASPSPLLAERQPGRARRRVGRTDEHWWLGAAAVASLVAGTLLASSGADLIQSVGDDSGVNLALRRQYEVGPLLPGLIAGVALAVCGAVALALVGLRRHELRHARCALGCCLGLVVPTALFRLGDAAEVRHAGYGWLVDGTFGFGGAGWLAVAVAALVGLALYKAGVWRRSTWAPRRRVAWAVGVATLWGASLFVDVYTREGSTYGSLVDDKSGGTAAIWYVLAVVSVVALTFVGLRWLVAPVGPWLLVATAATPLILVIAELAYLVEGKESPDASWLWLMVLPALALVGLGVSALVLWRREATDDATIGR